MTRTQLIMVLLMFLTLNSAFSTEMSQRGPVIDRHENEPLYQLSDVIKRATDRSSAQLIKEPGGDLMLELNGGHKHVYMARVAADGKIETFCATSEKAVRTWLFERPVSEE